MCKTYDLPDITDRDITIESVRLLARAIIIRAIRDYKEYEDSEDEKKRKVYLEAKEWIFDSEFYEVPEVKPEKCTCDKISKYCPFCIWVDQVTSFDTLCETVGWDPCNVRNGILKLQKRDLRRLGRSFGW